MQYQDLVAFIHSFVICFLNMKHIGKYLVIEVSDLHVNFVILESSHFRGSLNQPEP